MGTRLRVADILPATTFRKGDRASMHLAAAAAAKLASAKQSNKVGRSSPLPLEK
jgi:hypothetical protein